MSHLGGFSYGGEKIAIVFDIGNAYTKCGFAGENGPRAIIASEVKSRKNGNVNTKQGYKHLKFHIREYDKLISKMVLRNKLDNDLWTLKTSCGIQQVMPIFEAYADEEELCNKLSDFFYYLYFRHLLVNPKERRVVIVESVLTPTVFRHAIAKVLFKHYEVPSVLFAPSHLVAILTLGIQSALVVDAGYKETLVLPIYEGTPLLKAWEALPLAGKAIHDYLEAQLLESATITSQDGEKPASSVFDKISTTFLENIKVRCCFVTRLDRAKKIQLVNQGKAESDQAPDPPPDVDYPLDGEKILHINGKIREYTCEVLFEQDNEQTSIATLLLDSLLKCPVDTRKTLSENIVIMGGTSMLTGFHHRLQSELQDLMQLERYSALMKTWNFRFHQPPSKPNYTAWLGGAILGGLEILGSRSVTRDAYNKQEIIPDWCCLYEPEEKEEKLATPLKR